MCKRAAAGQLCSPRLVIGPLIAVLSAAPPARAFEAVVNSRFDAQYYQMRSPGSPLGLTRERFTERLGLSLYDLQGRPEKDHPRIDGKFELRFDTDLGVDVAEVDPNRDDRFLPGLSPATLDVMYGYVEGRGFLDGILGFRAGRQYQIGPLGFWSFDGALVSVTTPVFFSVELFGGFEQRGGVPLSTPRFEPDGVWRGERTDLELRQWPEYLDTSLVAPSWGFNVKSEGVHFLDAALSYRKVINRDPVIVSPFANDDGSLTRLSGDRTSAERIGMALNASEPDLGAVSGNGVYDLYMSRPSEYGAGVTVYATSDVRVGASYAYYRPAYDGDSIFNWFPLGGTTTGEGRATWDATRRLSVAGSGGVRRFSTEEEEGKTEPMLDGLGSLEARYRYPTGEIGARTSAEGGERGRIAGTDVRGTHYFQNGLYDAGVIVSLYEWSDPLRPDNDATTFTYVLVGGFSPFEWTRAALEWEHSMSRLVGNRLRLLLSLDVAFR